MKKTLFTFIAIIFVFSGYCAETKIIVNSKFGSEFVLRLFSVGGMSNVVFEGNIKSGNNEFTADIKELKYYGVSQNKQYCYALIAPEKELIININKDGGMTFDGNYGAVNSYITTLVKAETVNVKNPENLKFTKDFCASRIAFYKNSIKEIDKSSLSSIDKNIVKGYAQGALLADIYGAIISSKVFGKAFKIVVEEGYSNDMAKIELSSGIIYYPQSFEYITELCYSRMAIGKIKLKDADNWIVEFAKSIKDISVRDAYITYTIERESMMNYMGGKERSEKALKLISSPELKEKAEKLISSFKDVVGGGYDVSNIETVDKDGKKVLLGQFKGKYIFVDFWSTGCNPCIGEIPYMKAIEHSLHSSNLDFVSITLDTETDVWKKFLVDNNMGGNQLFLVNGFKNPIRQAIGMRGIPHFMLIGPDSKIVNPNIYRPSNPVLKEQLKSITSK